MPEENNIAGNLLQTQEEENNEQMQQRSLYQAPQYNPLMGVTPRKFYQAMSGNNPSAPLVTTDAYGFPKFHLENIGKGGPAEIQVGQFGVNDVKGRKEAMDQHVTELSNNLGALVSELAPELNKDNQQSNRFKQLLLGAENFISETPKSAGAIALNSIHGIQAQGRNYQEFSWDIFRQENKDRPAFDEAGYAYKQLEDQGFSSEAILNPANIEKMQISNEAKDVLYRYKELQDSRRADERRMQTAMTYDRDMTNVQEFGNKLLNPTDADQESMFAMMGNMTGNVVGSLAAFWTVGRLTGGLAAGGARLAGLTVGLNGGAEASLALAANVGEKAVFVPSFLNQYNQIRTQALIAGKDINEANAIGFMAGMAEGGLEFAGFKFFKRFYRADGAFRTYIMQNILPESLQEGTQTLAENVITQNFGVTDKQWVDIMSEIGLSMVAGAMGGGLFTAGRMRYHAAMAYLGAVNEEFTDSLSNVSTEDINTGVKAAEANADVQESPSATQEQKEEAKKQYETLSADQKKAAQAYEEAYGKLKDYYTKEAKRVSGGKITDAQLANGWKAIRAMINLQRDGNVLVETFHDSVNKMVAYIDRADKETQLHADAVKNTLMNHGFTQEQVDALTSKDAIKANEAKWDLAEQNIVDELKMNGAREAESKVYARFVRGLLKDSTLINPNSDPGKIVKAMHANVLNLKHAIFYKEDLPEELSPITYKIKKELYIDKLNPEQAREFAFHIADAISGNKTSPAIAKDINLKLYGDREYDPNLDRLRALADTQAEMLGKVVNKMPSNLDIQLAPQSIKAMWLMNQFGYNWDRVFNAFGIDGATEDGFLQTADEFYREPNSTEIDRLFAVADNMRGTGVQSESYSGIGEDEGREAPAYTEQELENIRSGKSFYEQDKNLIVLNRMNPGTALHEYGHFSLSYMAAVDTQLLEAGLLDDAAPISAMFAHLSELMQREGKILTETQFQETVNDAIAQFIERGQAQDPVLSGLINQMKEEQFKASKQLVGSLISGTKSQVDAESKKRIISNVGAILEGVTASSMLQEALELREMSALKNMPEDVEAGRSMIMQMADITENFLKTRPTNNADKNLELLKVARRTNNLLAVAEIANNVASDAINVATDFFIQGADLEENFEGTKYLMQGDTGIFFENDAAASMSRNDAAFREEKPLAQHIKEAIKNSAGIKELVIGTGKKYLQSLEGAAGEISNEIRSNEIRNIIMREGYEKAMKVQRFREKLAPVVNEIDKKFDAMSREQKREATRKWRNNFHAVLGSGEGGYKKSTDFIRKELGDKFAKQWESVLQELQDVKYLLIAAGLPKQLFAYNGDYFPMAVKDFVGLSKEYFGHSNTYNFIDKEKARIIDDYKRRKNIKELTPEQEAELDVLITDGINSQFQRNTTDENKVTSFMRRKVHNYTEDPSILAYYENPFDTLDRYMDAAYNTIMMRNLIGKTTFSQDGQAIFVDSVEEKDDVIARGKVGRYLAQLPAGAIPDEVLYNFWEKMRSLSQRDSGAKNDILEFVRQVNQITTLGNPFSTINQLQDLEFCFTMFGIKATTDAIQDVINSNKKVTRLADVGALQLNEAFRIEGKGAMQRLTEKVFGWSGFEWTDRAIKEVILNATTNYAKDVLTRTAKLKEGQTVPQSLARDLKQLNLIIDECFPPANEMMFAQSVSENEMQRAKQQREAIRNQVKKDLMEGNSTDDTRYIQWYMLTKLQPQNAMSVPGIYNTTNSFGKLCYQFTTVATRQIGFMADYFKMQEKIGGSKLYAAKQMAKLAMFCIGIGIPREVVEALLRGQKPNIWKGAALSPLHVLMINEYTLSVLKNEGLARAVMTQYTPGFSALDNVSRDFIRLISGKSYKGYTFKSVPLIGWAAWSWLLGGFEQSKKEGKNLLGGTYDPKQARRAKSDAQKALKQMEDF